MDQDLTGIICVVDRSGSMEAIREDAIGGFNTFLADQKKLPGKAEMTIALFDDQYDVIHRCTPINDVAPFDNTTFVPRGSTALLDAIGRTMNEVGAELANRDEAARPGKVIMVILTDGQENSSREFNRQKILEMITHQQDAYQWEFIYLAAGQDAIGEAGMLGIRASNAINFNATGKGVKASYDAISCSVGSYRSVGKVADWSVVNNAEDLDSSSARN